jgi:hypothetical protein
MSELLVPSSEVSTFIPQRDPIVMVDGLLSHSADASTSILTIRTDNIFVSEGLLQAPGLIEHIAQTAALRAGYSHKLLLLSEEGAAVAPPVGFIGEVKNLTISHLPPIGSTLHTTVTVIHDVFTASIIRGEVLTAAGVGCAACEMKIFRQG